MPSREPPRTLPARSLELFFDYSCPYAYLASHEVVARAIEHAIAHDEAVVPVAAEAHVLRFMSRFAPSLVRRLGAMSLGPKPVAKGGRSANHEKT